MSDVTLFLPWPPSGLSPNARMHWRGRARLASLYRHQCAWLSVTECAPYRRLAAERADARINVDVEFRPPDRRRRDLDNCIAAFKAGADGVADATGIDDGHWTATYRMGTPRHPGEVVVRLSLATKGDV